MSRDFDIDDVRRFLRGFAEKREWQQYHTPKNLAMALAGEAGELLEVFQWLTPEESMNLSSVQLQATADELADVLQYVIRLADVLNIELAGVLWDKLERNDQRYPADEVRGSAEKR